MSVSRHTLAIVAIAAVGALAGCGGGDGDGATSGPATSRPATSPGATSGPGAKTDRSTAMRPDASGDMAASRARRDRGPRAVRGLELSRIGRFDTPTYVAAPPDDRRRLFVVEQGGAIRVIERGHLLERPFLDITSRVRSSGSEQGLLSMAFAPDYRRSRRFYVDYTDRDGNTRVVEYRRSRGDANRAVPRSARQILFQAQPQSNHNGGQLEFGPDGLLYIGLGDGGGAGDQHGTIGNGQNLTTLLGKILRVDPRRRSAGRPYAIPRGNPFAGRGGGVRPQIYAYGLRNPWRFSFDRGTGNMIIADVGESRFEEVDFARRGQARGANYGWRVFEGRSRFSPGSAPGHVAPVLVYPHQGGNCSITGGYVIRDRRLRGMRGRYLYGDFCVGRIFSTVLRPGHASRPRSTGMHVDQLSSFGEDARGRLYATSLDGPVYRIDPARR